MAVNWLTIPPQGLNYFYPSQISRMVPVTTHFGSTQPERAEFCRSVNVASCAHASRTIVQIATRVFITEVIHAPVTYDCYSRFVGGP